METIKQIQEQLGVKADGIWGPKSQTALNSAIKSTAESSHTLRRIQQILKEKDDGIWGPKSQAALNAVIGSRVFSCDASSFADPADVRAFNNCKRTGKTDNQCFAVGDNGIGQFGKITAQDHTPMIAVHKNDMITRWGSVQGAAHRPVRVTIHGHTFDATVEDRISAPGRIDLNPACAKLASLQPPFVVSCTWSWL